MNIRKTIQDQVLRSLLAYSKETEDVLAGESVDTLAYMISDEIRLKKPEIYTTKEALANSELILKLFAHPGFSHEIVLYDPIKDPSSYMGIVVWHIVHELLMTSPTYLRLRDAGAAVDISNSELPAIRNEIKEAIAQETTYFDLVVPKQEQVDETDATV